jgi:hypothetical protein
MVTVEKHFCFELIALFMAFFHPGVKKLNLACQKKFFFLNFHKNFTTTY